MRDVCVERVTEKMEQLADGISKPDLMWNEIRNKIIKIIIWKERNHTKLKGTSGGMKGEESLRISCDAEQLVQVKNMRMNF